jgi:hypothetical protein
MAPANTAALISQQSSETELKVLLAETLFGGWDMSKQYLFLPMRCIQTREWCFMVYPAVLNVYPLINNTFVCNCSGMKLRKTRLRYFHPQMKRSNVITRVCVRYSGHISPVYAETRSWRNQQGQPNST